MFQLYFNRLQTTNIQTIEHIAVFEQTGANKARIIILSQVMFKCNMYINNY